MADQIGLFGAPAKKPAAEPKPEPEVDQEPDDRTVRFPTHSKKTCPECGAQMIWKCVPDESGGGAVRGEEQCEKHGRPR